MPRTSKPASRGHSKAVNFVAPRNGLLDHFHGEGDRTGRKWRELFGFERKPEKPKGGKSFNAREARRSSSDS